MARGGPRPGAGRKPGTPNKATIARQEEVAASGVTPLEYMLEVMRNPLADETKRLDAAKAAAPFVHPRLSTVDVGNKDDKPFEQVMRWATSADEATPDPSKL